MSPERWRQVEELYNAALAIEPRGRAAFVAQEAEGDEELRREVESLIAQTSSRDTLMERPAWHGDASVSATQTATALSSGSLIGPYRLGALLGSGGMGRVYQARDTRLERSVAIKICHGQFSERFLREARAIAALNHPHICTLHDLGPDYLVMEHVEGKPPKGPLPLQKVLEYGAQICEALEAAHRKGIVHRDLKPANILLTRSGVKVLDFGLAKMTGQETVTQAGTVMGTPAYMAPEQREGKDVDLRADIYSLGCVLYEMATGERTEHRALEPPALDRVVKTCMARDPEERWQSAREVKLALEFAGQPVANAPAHKSSGGRISWIVAALAGVVASALAFVHFGEKPPVAEAVHFQIQPPENSRFLGNDTLVSPDGRRIAFGLPAADGRKQLWVRSLGTSESKPLAGTEGVGDANFWSPDSRFLGFHQQGNLMKVDASGGPPQIVCDVPARVSGQSWTGGAWNRDGVILFGAIGSGLWRVSDSGGTREPVTRVDPTRKDSFHAGPAFLPDGRHFLYEQVGRNGRGSRGIYIGSLDVKPEEQSSKPLLDNVSSSAVYIPGADGNPSIGHLLYTRNLSLMAQTFDVRRLELSGEATPVVERLGAGGARHFSASMTGVLAYRAGIAVEGFEGAVTQLTWFDRQGNILATEGEPAGYDSVALSPDGKRVAVSRNDHQAGTRLSARPFDIWVHEFVHGTSAPLTSNHAHNPHAVWSQDGKRVIFSSDPDGSAFNLYQKVSSGAGNEDPLFKSNEDKSVQDWSRDGRFLLFSQTVGVRGTRAAHDLWVLPLPPDNPANPRAEPYVTSEFDENQAQFSPNDRFIAYKSDASGRDEIWVQPFPATSDEKWKVSEGGGTQPRWGGDGKELFYISPDSRMMSVEVNTDRIFKIGPRKSLFPAPIWGGGSTRQVTRYDVTADGKKFLINTGPPQPPLPLPWC